MRVSPIAYMFDDIDKIMEEVEKCTTTSHNTNEAITGAKAVASAIYLSRKKKSKEYIKIFSFTLLFNFSSICIIPNTKHRPL